MPTDKQIEAAKLPVLNYMCAAFKLGEAGTTPQERLDMVIACTNSALEAAEKAGEI